MSCLPLGGDDVVGGTVACTYIDKESRQQQGLGLRRQRGQATGRLRVKGSVAHVVWCDVSKSKQKEVLLESGQC